MTVERLPLSSRFLCTLDVHVGPVVTLGEAAHGERRFVDILGGAVDGPGLIGSIVPGGADWQVVRRDAVLEIDAHYSLLLDDGARVEVSSIGFRHGSVEALARLARGDAVPPSEYFFRTAIRFQTGALRLAHLNRTLAIGVGARLPDRVRLTVHDIV